MCLLLYDILKDRLKSLFTKFCHKYMKKTYKRAIPLYTPQQIQTICIIFVQGWSSVKDVGYLLGICRV